MLQGLEHFDEILREEDGIIISRGHLGIDLPLEKVAFDIWCKLFSYIHFLMFFSHR